MLRVLMTSIYYTPSHYRGHSLSTFHAGNYSQPYSTARLKTAFKKFTVKNDATFRCALLTILIKQQSAFAVTTNSIYLPAFSICNIQGTFVIWQKGEYWALLTAVMVRHSKIPTLKTMYDLIVRSPREALMKIIIFIITYLWWNPFEKHLCQKYKMTDGERSEEFHSKSLLHRRGWVRKKKQHTDTHTQRERN